VPCDMQLACLKSRSTRSRAWLARSCIYQGLRWPTTIRAGGSGFNASGKIIEALTYVKFEFTDCILEVNEKRDTYGDERLAIDLRCVHNQGFRVKAGKESRNKVADPPVRWPRSFGVPSYWRNQSSSFRICSLKFVPFSLSFPFAGMAPPPHFLALCLAITASPVFSAAAGSFGDGGNTLISAMMVG